MPVHRASSSQFTNRGRHQHGLLQTLLDKLKASAASHAFTVESPDGLALVDRTPTVDEVHNHTDAITLIRAWLQDYFADGTLLAVGHRVVHGGQHYSAPVLIDATVLAELENQTSSLWLHCISRTTSRLSAHYWKPCRHCRKWPALTLRFTARSPCRATLRHTPALCR